MIISFTSLDTKKLYFKSTLLITGIGLPSSLKSGVQHLNVFGLTLGRIVAELYLCKKRSHAFLINGSNISEIFQQSVGVEEKLFVKDIFALSAESLFYRAKTRTTVKLYSNDLSMLRPQMHSLL